MKSFPVASLYPPDSFHLLLKNKTIIYVFQQNSSVYYKKIVLLITDQTYFKKILMHTMLHRP